MVLSFHCSPISCLIGQDQLSTVFATALQYIPVLLCATVPYCRCSSFKPGRECGEVFSTAFCFHFPCGCLLWCFLSRSAKPSHLHSRVTSVGFMSEAASYNTIFTMMRPPVCFSALGRTRTSGVCVCYITVAFGLCLWQCCEIQRSCWD